MSAPITVDAVVIGGGVVGLALARAIGSLGMETLLLEKEKTCGTGISSRNSEVIHAGLYYRKHDLKAVTCVRGKHLLYEFAEKYGVPHSRCGKLVVASSPAEHAKLDELWKQGQSNGVKDLRIISAVEAQELEPELQCTKALISNSTGIVDSHSFMLALQGTYEDLPVDIATSTPVLSINNADKSGLLVHTGGAEPIAISAKFVINSAGLAAPAIASSVTDSRQSEGGKRIWRSLEPRLAKGNYFQLMGRSPFSRLIYPVPEPGGLGVHATIDLAGNTRFGPDVEWVEKEHYTVDAQRSQVFYDRIRKYWPNLSDDSLVPDYCGIRPKLFKNGKMLTDFVIEGAEAHGIPGLVNLLGIESPGLTASLGIAELVVEKYFRRSGV